MENIDEKNNLSINSLKVIVLAVIIWGTAESMEQVLSIPEILTIEDYNKVSADEKAKLNADFQKIINQPVRDLFLKIDNYHIFRDHRNFDKLIFEAQKINDQYKNCVVVSLGQSPAYIVKAAEILNELHDNKNNNEYKYIAFSGRFLKEKEDSHLIESSKPPYRIFEPSYSRQST